MTELSLEQEINEHELKIENAKKDIIESEIIVKYLKSKLSNNQSNQQNSNQNTKSVDLDIDELISVSSNKETRTLLSDVMEAVSHFGDREFNVLMIKTVMERLGTIKDSDDKLIKSKISSVLSQQAKKNILINTFKSGGNVPNKYRVRTESDELINDISDANVSEQNVVTDNLLYAEGFDGIRDLVGKKVEERSS